MVDCVLQIDHKTLLEMPVDQVGLLVLKDLLDTDQWSRHNYLNDYRNAGTPAPVLRVLAEAVEWLSGRGLIATDPEQSTTSAFVTRIGRRVVEQVPTSSMPPSACSVIYIRRSRRRPGRNF